MFVAQQRRRSAVVRDRRMTDAWVPSGNDLKPSGLSIHTHVDAVDDAVEVGHLEGARTAAGERGATAERGYTRRRFVPASQHQGLQVAIKSV